MNYEELNKELMDELNSLPEEQRNAVIEEVYNQVKKTFEEAISPNDLYMPMSWNEESFRKTILEMEKRNGMTPQKVYIPKFL